MRDSKTKKKAQPFFACIPLRFFAVKKIKLQKQIKAIGQTRKI
jgi:hypothetical protein